MDTVCTSQYLLSNTAKFSNMLQTCLIELVLELAVAVPVVAARLVPCAALSNGAVTIGCTRPFYRDSNCGDNLFGGLGARRGATC